MHRHTPISAAKFHQEHLPPGKVPMELKWSCPSLKLREGSAEKVQDSSGSFSLKNLGSWSFVMIGWKILLFPLYFIFSITIYHLSPTPFSTSTHLLHPQSPHCCPYHLYKNLLSDIPSDGTADPRAPDPMEGSWLPASPTYQPHLFLFIFYLLIWKGGWRRVGGTER